MAIPINFNPVEVRQFRENWGQSHEEVCSCLGYEEATADDLLKDTYFWEERTCLWMNKSAANFTMREQEIATFLMTNT